MLLVNIMISRLQNRYLFAGQKSEDSAGTDLGFYDQMNTLFPLHSGLDQNQADRFDERS